MTATQTDRRAMAAEEFNQHEQRNDGAAVVNSLGDGFKLLSQAMFTRIHTDVVNKIGMDSMLAPISILKSEDEAKDEIDIYQIFESDLHVRRHHYVNTDGEWCLAWLGRLRLDDPVKSKNVSGRIAYYLKHPSEERGKAFATVLERAFPEATKAPLILYRLLPLAVRVVSSIAFVDHATAEDARRKQNTLLPVIRDCGDCHGELLDNGDQCSRCGNPLWFYDWLTAE